MYDIFYFNSIFIYGNIKSKPKMEKINIVDE